MWKVELIVALAVPALIGGTGSSSFPKRERCTAALYRLMPYSQDHLARAYGHADPEISDRCRLIVRGWWGEFADRWVEENGPRRWPWIDMLPKDAPAAECAQTLFLVPIKHMHSSSPPDWTAYRKAMKDYSVFLLRTRRMTQGQLRELLEKCRKNEDEWTNKNRNNYTPPLP